MSGLLELLVDGAPVAADWPLDRGLLYGDGVFETMQVSNGRVRFEDLHRARLQEGCRRLQIAIELERTWATVRQHAVRYREATVRLQVTRGMALVRGYAPTGQEQARSILAIFGPSADASLPRPLRVQRLRCRLGENPDLAGLKHCNRLEQVLARQSMADSTAHEGLLASSSGVLISGTMSNVFVELDDRLVTPALDRCGVAGVMRAVVLREAARAGIEVQVADVPFEALQRVSALALSNARIGLVAVDYLDDRPLASSERFNRLASRVASLEA
jgi:4-amino-4-deoxychorismate lyase